MSLLGSGERFDELKAKVGLVVGPLIAVVVWATSSFHMPALPALMALCVVWWITEALPPAVVALAAALGAILCNIATPQVAFAAFGKPQLFLFVGSFMVAKAMELHGLGQRLARALTRGATSERSMLLRLGIASFILSTAMSNAAATAMLLPIALSAAGSNRRLASALVLVVAWGASVGGIGTPVGTPPNLFGIEALRKLGHDLSFGEWMAFGVPLGAVMMIALTVVLSVGFRISSEPTPALVASENVAWNRGEKSVVVAIVLALIGWILPSVLLEIAPTASASLWCKAHLTEEVVAVASALLLFVLPGPSPKSRALTWEQAVQIDWGVIILFGGGILLGELAGSTGLSNAWGTSLVELTSAHSTFAITALCTGIAIVLSEATSNTATATLMAPLAGQLATAAGASPVAAVLGATLGSSFGFMLPISTAPNALAYGTGKVTVSQMIRNGIVFDLLGFVIIVGGVLGLGALFGYV